VTEGKLVIGLVRTRADAERVFERLMSCGYRRDAISLVMSDAARRDHFALDHGAKAPAPAVGAGAIGAVVATVAAMGTRVALAGVDLVAAGPLAATLAGAGGATGGLLDVLVRAGIPEYRARFYETGLKEGGMLLGVQALSERDANLLETILEDAGAENVRSESSRQRPYDSFF
jgi:hypothetical protein